MKIIREIISWTKALLFAFILTIITIAFVIQPLSVIGSSMEPTLEGKDLENSSKKGDYVIVLKLNYLLGAEPKYNDIVVIDSRVDKERTLLDNLLEVPIVKKMLKNQESEKNYWVKRVIGTPGDLLEYRDGKVYRNGKELEEDYIKEEMFYPFESIVVPENHVYVMGDNRNGSVDSREIGPVPYDHVLGKVFLRYYPLDKITNFGI